MYKFIKLIRVKHYIKNILIFLPIIFSKNITNLEYLTKTIFAFFIFCLLSSAIYILNDLIDIERDRKHPTKRNRPLASGEITKKQAMIIMLIILLLCIIGSIILLKNNIISCLILIIYLLLNIAYSYKLKKVPIIDIVILALGYLLRVLYGASVIMVPVSNWLYLTVLSVSFYMGMGKRRSEINVLKKDNTREVLKYYNTNFLNENMYMCLTLAIVFYSLWCIDASKQINNYINIIYTIPIVVIISMKYSLNIEKGNYEDPVEIILKDKTIIILSIILVLLFGINYI